jgi:hypothetical protein
VPFAFKTNCEEFSIERFDGVSDFFYKKHTFQESSFWIFVSGTGWLGWSFNIFHSPERNIQSEIILIVAFLKDPLSLFQHFAFQKGCVSFLQVVALSCAYNAFTPVIRAAQNYPVPQVYIGTALCRIGLEPQPGEKLIAEKSSLFKGSMRRWRD